MPHPPAFLENPRRGGANCLKQKPVLDRERAPATGESAGAIRQLQPRHGRLRWAQEFFFEDWGQVHLTHPGGGPKGESLGAFLRSIFGLKN